MTAGNLRACLTALRWTGADLARALDCEHTTVRRWLAGANVPKVVNEWLLDLSGCHAVRPAPEQWKRRQGEARE